eukprot:jgi/Botrbrau1/14668/Bobra.0108s0027.3
MVLSPSYFGLRSTASLRAAADTDVPLPVITIDNHSDPFATVVGIQFGDRLGELLDTMAALKNLQLNITRAKINKEVEQGKPITHVFYVTDAKTSEKVLKSSKVEAIRTTILSNLVKYHEEAKDKLSWSTPIEHNIGNDVLSPLGPPARMPVETRIEIDNIQNGRYSILKITTGDRPGLLTDIVRILKDISINLVSAEIDTEGVVAKDEFYITYHGDALNPSMTTLVKNALQYYLTIAAIQQEDSY